MKVVCIIQARLGSTRLPNKVAMPILGKPMLALQLERDMTASMVRTFMVATTDRAEDEHVAAIARTCGAEVYRGSEHDVLDRYYQAAKAEAADIVVRVTGDCPLHYGAVIDETVQHFMSVGCDYARSPSNYPEGLDTEVFTFTALEKAWLEASLPSEREHVTPYFYTHPELFRVAEEWTPLSGPQSAEHWSVDTEEDFVFVTNICEALSAKQKDFTKNDVLTLLLQHPEWRALTAGRTGYEGYAKSLEEDKKSMNL